MDYVERMDTFNRLGGFKVHPWGRLVMKRVALKTELVTMIDKIVSCGVSTSQASRNMGKNSRFLYELRKSRCRPRMETMHLIKSYLKSIEGDV